MEYKRLEAYSKYEVDELLKLIAKNGWDIINVVMCDTGGADGGWHIFVKVTKASKVLFGEK